MTSALERIQSRAIPIQSEVAYDVDFSEALTDVYRSFGGAYRNNETGFGGSQDKNSYGAVNPLHWLPREALRALGANDWVVHKVLKLISNDCVRAGFELAFEDEGDQVSLVNRELRRLRAKRVFTETKFKALQFGDAAVLLFVDDGRFDMSWPLFRGKGAKKKLVPIKEIMGLYCLEAGYEGPLQPASQPPKWAPGNAPLIDWTPGPHFGKPIWWEWNPVNSYDMPADTPAQTMLIHRDRLIFFHGASTDDETKLQRNGHPLSLIDIMEHACQALGLTMGVVSNIIADFFTAVYKIKGLRKIAVAGVGPNGKTGMASLMDRLKADTLARSIVNAHVVDTDEEDFTKVGSPVSGLHDLVWILMVVTAGAAGTSVRKLFGVAPPGSQADSKSDEDNHADLIGGEQEGDFEPGWRTLIDIVLAVDGRTDEHYEIRFNPLRMPSLKEQAETRRTQAHADELYLLNGILKREEVRKGRFGGPGYSVDTRVVGPPPDLEEIPQRVGSSFSSPGPGAGPKSENSSKQGKSAKAVGAEKPTRRLPEDD